MPGIFNWITRVGTGIYHLAYRTNHAYEPCRNVAVAPFSGNMKNPQSSKVNHLAARLGHFVRLRRKKTQTLWGAYTWGRVQATVFS